MEKIYFFLRAIKANVGATAKIEMQLNINDSVRIKVGWMKPDLSDSRSFGLEISREQIDNSDIDAVFDAFCERIASGA